MRSIDPAVVAGVVAVLVGMAGTLRYYQRAGSLPLAKLPWYAVRKLVFVVRMSYFRVGKPPRTVSVSVPDSEMMTLLASNGHAPGWPLAYQYQGEEAAYRIYYYDPTAEYPHRQIHTRRFADGIYAHDEPDALHHPKAHIRSNDMTDVSDAVAAAVKRASEGGECALLPRNIMTEHNSRDT